MAREHARAGGVELSEPRVRPRVVVEDEVRAWPEAQASAPSAAARKRGAPRARAPYGVPRAAGDGGPWRAWNTTRRSRRRRIEARYSGRPSPSRPEERTSSWCPSRAGSSPRSARGRARRSTCRWRAGPEPSLRTGAARRRLVVPLGRRARSRRARCRCRCPGQKNPAPRCTQARQRARHGAWPAPASHRGRISFFLGGRLAGGWCTSASPTRASAARWRPSMQSQARVAEADRSRARHTSQQMLSPHAGRARFDSRGSISTGRPARPAREISAVLLDLTMPRLDGLATLQRIREHSKPARGADERRCARGVPPELLALADGFVTPFTATTTATSVLPALEVATKVERNDGKRSRRSHASGVERSEPRSRDAGSRS